MGSTLVARLAGIRQAASATMMQQQTVTAIGVDRSLTVAAPIRAARVSKRLPHT